MPSELSGGMRKRVALARAIIRDTVSDKSDQVGILSHFVAVIHLGMPTTGGSTSPPFQPEQQVLALTSLHSSCSRLSRKIRLQTDTSRVLQQTSWHNQGIG